MRKGLRLSKGESLAKCYIGAYIKTEAYLDKKLQVVMFSKAGTKPLHVLELKIP